MAPQSSLYQEPAHHEIAAYARSIWESEGCPEGREISHWFQAKAHLIAARQLEAGMIRPRGSKTRVDSVGRNRSGEDTSDGDGETRPAKSAARKRQGRTLPQFPR